MSYRCGHCGKGRGFGETHKHGRGVASHKFHNRAHRTKRTWLPNLHSAKIAVGGVVKKMKLCTKCLRKLKANKASAV